jgi:serine/threonine-protein kinase
LAKFKNWFNAASKSSLVVLLVAVAGVIVALLAWLFPQPPDPTPTPNNFTPAANSRKFQLGAFNGLLRHPGGVAVDHDGTVYVADHDGDRVLELEAGSPGPTTMPQFNGVHWPAGVAVDAHRNIYVADSGNNRVLKWAQGSEIATPIAEFTGRLSSPRGVAVDASSNVYVADSGHGQVLELLANSEAVDQLPFVNLTTPSSVAVDDAGSVYVADEAVPHVSELTQGAQSELFSYPPTVLRGPRGLAVDNNFGVYVTDFPSNQVLKLGKDAPAPVPAGFTDLDGPTGVAVDNKGNVFVADWGNGGGGVLKAPPS